MMFTNYRFNTFLILRDILFSMGARRDNSPMELLRGATGFSTWPFFVDASDKRFNKRVLTAMLKRYGITIGGFGYHNGRYMFRVRRGQAVFAEQIMVKAGVPVRGKRLTR